MTNESMTEKILCVLSTSLTEETTGRELMRLSRSEGQWLERDEVEEDVQWRQIIPYIVMTSSNAMGASTVFAYRRLSGSGESRLIDQWSVGIGGHVEEQDSSRGSPIIDCIYREIAEELKVPKGYKIDVAPEPVGILLLDDTPVDMVHVGLVFAGEIYSSSILAVPGAPIRTDKTLEVYESNEPDKIQGEMLTSAELHTLRDSGDRVFETWSNHVIGMLKNDRVEPEEWTT